MHTMRTHVLESQIHVWMARKKKQGKREQSSQNINRHHQNISRVKMFCVKWEPVARSLLWAARVWLGPELIGCMVPQTLALAYNLADEKSVKNSQLFFSATFPPGENMLLVILASFFCLSSFHLGIIKRQRRSTSAALQLREIKEKDGKTIRSLERIN